MAEQKDDIEIVEESSGGKGKLLIIIIAVLLLAGGGAAAFFLMGGDEADENAGETAEKAEAAPVKLPPIYYAVEAPFIINFSEQSNNAVRFLQVKMKVMARDQAIIDAFQSNLPAIQHEMLMLLYSQKYDVLQTTEGTKALQQACLDTINMLLKSESSSDKGLEAVYFTSFLMQ